MSTSRKANARTVARGSPSYPSRLERLPKPPPRLWVEGMDPTEFGPCIAIVGTRSPTPYGLDVAHQLAGDLAAAGMCIVSGLARGVDAAAHAGALDTGGVTVAVLGNGIDVVHPRSNEHLYEQVAKHGALLTQFEPGTAAFKSHFPERNRIVAALSLAVVVVQARDRRSGALSTAAAAREIGVEVLAVPGDVRADVSGGAHALIRDGAALCAKASDVLDQIAEQLRHIESPRGPSAEERALLEAMPAEPINAEQLAMRAGLPPLVALRELGRLEMRNLVTRVPGGYARA